MLVSPDLVEIPVTPVMVQSPVTVADATATPLALTTVTVTDARNASRTVNGRIPAGPPNIFFEDIDGDGYGNPNSIAEECHAPVGFVAVAGDCNDLNALIHPGANEVCNGWDDDCDGLIDEDVQLTFFKDEDGDSYGNVSIRILACVAPSGYVSDSSDCNDAIASIHPGAREICNGLDDDCNGFVDDGVAFFFYRDADGDGYGDPYSLTFDCSAPSGYVSDSTDCNDNDSTKIGRAHV